MLNKALSELLFQLAKKFEGFKYSLFDLHTSILQRVEDPSQYGLKEGKASCCGAGKYGGIYNCGGIGDAKNFNLCTNPDEHVFWDAFHLTENAYKQFAEEMWSGSDKSLDVGTYSIKELFQLDESETWSGNLECITKH